MLVPALALTACSASGAIDAGVIDAGGLGKAPEGAPATGATEAATHPPTGPAVPPRPSLAEITQRFGGRTPHAWGLDVPGVVTRSNSPAVALTFDACGGPGGTGVDTRLLAVLRKNKVPATLFLNARWIAANPGMSSELAADPLFELADHGTAHRPLSVSGRSAYGIPGTPSVAAVYEELVSNRAHLESLVAHPSPWFRPGTAFYDEVGAEVVRALGLVPVNFSVNGDGGATFSAAQVTTAVAAAGPGDIVISHMNRPGSGTAPGYEAALPRMLGKGVTFATLSKAGVPLA